MFVNELHRRNGIRCPCVISFHIFVEDFFSVFVAFIYVFKLLVTSFYAVTARLIIGISEPFNVLAIQRMEHKLVHSVNFQSYFLPHLTVSELRFVFVSFRSVR